MQRTASVFLAFSVCLVAAAQETGAAARWTGEWGGFKEGQAGGEMRSEGQRLSVTSCLRETCQAVISTSKLAGEHCDGTGELHVTSATQATLTLKAIPEKKAKECALDLTLRESGKERSIAVKPVSKSCGAFCTPKCSFEREFAFRSATAFAGDDIPGCYLQRSKAALAVCSDKPLADLQKTWMELSDSINALYAKPFDAKVVRDRAQAKCDTAEDPASCLRAFFRDDGNRLSRLKAQWRAGISKPGNGKDASRKATAIAGTYVPPHGRLEITPEPDSKLRFKANVNADGGRSCSVEGDAAYKANGAFVFQSDESGESCVLEIFAGEKAVELQDPLGSCKSYCEAGGTLAGAKFPYTDRKTSTR